MSIAFPCTCGQMLGTEDHYAGKMICCPMCDAVVVVPSPRNASTPTASTGIVADIPNQGNDSYSRKTSRGAISTKKPADYSAGTEGVPFVQSVEHHEFEIVESVRDLPTVERVSEPRGKGDRSRKKPMNQNLEYELYNRRDYVFRMDRITLTTVLLGCFLAMSLGVFVVGLAYDKVIIFGPGLLGVILSIVLGGYLSQLKW
jgi:hypothetical protein